MDNKLPNLVNLNEDPQLSEMLLYMLKEGKKRLKLLSVLLESNTDRSSLGNTNFNIVEIL